MPYLENDNKGEANGQHSPELFGDFIWRVGPRRFSVVLISSEKREHLTLVLIRYTDSYFINLQLYLSVYLDFRLYFVTTKKALCAAIFLPLALLIVLPVALCLFLAIMRLLLSWFNLPTINRSIKLLRQLPLINYRHN